MFVDVLQQIRVNINAISRHNLDTVRNVDKSCQFGHTYASNLDLKGSVKEPNNYVPGL